MTETRTSAIKVFQLAFDAFTFLGKENLITETSNFGLIWGDFFELGGYEPILPYAKDSKPINIWSTNKDNQKLYLQGLIVEDVEKTPDGYQLIKFPATEFLVITTDWMSTNEEAVGDNGNGRCNRYAETVQVPDGYVRCAGLDCSIIKLEKENTDTPEGSRYEVWVPIKQQ